jgi:hypothetical protein
LILPLAALAAMSGLPDILKIPDGPEKLSLPSANLPVSDLIKFPLPPQRKSTVFTDPTDYLCDLRPSITAFDVLEIPVPPSFVVKALGRPILQDPEIAFIVLVHSPAHRDKGDRYPPWLATIWSAMERVREARTLWRTATERVDEMQDKLATTNPAAGRPAAALQALDKLPWDCSLKGFKASPSVKDFALWFTTDWLNTDHEDYMLELLATDLGLSDGSTSSIETTYFVQALEWAYSDPDAYRSGARFRWLRRLGTAFATKDRDRLGSIANINDNHWVALTIDCKENIIGYGDGFRGPAPASLRTHLNWWLFEHLGTKFKWKDISVPKQTDPHSCGILAYFALASWFDSERFPLPKSTAASMADERIKMFLRAIDQHEKDVS